jgi:16S rRNA (guanine527-N7)-methyltransferase
MENFAEQVFAQTGFRLQPAQLKALQRYESELLDWNSRHNLTAIRTSEEIWVKHFLDSLTCLQVMGNVSASRVIDVGTGAGFPGLVLKIAFPDLRLTLIESVGKKTAFCRHVVKRLEMDGVQVVQARAETVAWQPEHREGYDWAVARAVSALPVLAEYLLPFVRVGGCMLAMKGDSGPAEAHSAEGAIRLLGGHLRQLKPLTLPGVVEERYLVVVDKVAATPPRYPRRVGIPSKRPLK